MKGLVQRVSEASVEVDDREVSRIGAGILLLLGVEQGDGLNEAKELCRKVLTYRIFPDEAGRMNRSVLDTGGALLVVPGDELAEALDVLAEALECDAGDLVKGIQTVAGRPRPKRT